MTHYPFTQIKKYPRTQHFQGSRLQHDDHDLETIPFESVVGKCLVIEEKIDGSNVGISFDSAGVLLLQSRGHYLRGGPRERQFDILKQWANARQEELHCVLENRYIMYGEYMRCKHTCFYDKLPHYFMEFDIYDSHTKLFLSTDARKELLYGGDVKAPIVQVKELCRGQFKTLHNLEIMITRSNFITYQRGENLIAAAQAAGVDPDDAFKHTDMSEDMEGLYIKWEEDGVVKGRYKYVRQSFTNSIMDQEEHWHDRPIIQNKLEDGAYEKMFSQ